MRVALLTLVLATPAHPGSRTASTPALPLARPTPMLLQLVPKESQKKV